MPLTRSSALETLRRLRGAVEARLLLVAVLAAGCASTRIQSTVQQRMASDYGCHDATVTVTSLPDSAYQANGCGAQATYVCTLEANNFVLCVKQAGGTPVPGAGPSAVPPLPPVSGPPTAIPPSHP